MIAKCQSQSAGASIDRRKVCLPEAMIDPQLEKLQWRDEAKFALLRHVEVIYKGNQLLATSRAKHSLYIHTQ